MGNVNKLLILRDGKPLPAFTAHQLTSTNPAHSKRKTTMSADKGTKWEAPPHTIAKIEMLRKYLVVWLSIIGVKFRGSDIWYIDGFAGPGEYTNYAEGSPIAALRAAEEALQNTNAWAAGSVHCLFIEDDTERFAHLTEKLKDVPENPRVKRHLFNGTFIEGIEDLRRQQPNPFSPSLPLFAFIDPFGIKGLPFSLVCELLSKQSREVLINLDSDGIHRVYSAGQSANYRVRLNELFGDTDWERELADVPMAAIGKTFLAMYKRRIRAIPARYAFPFEMQSRQGKMDYHLVFATQHPLGLEKMKEVMRQFSHDGSYVFCDDRDDAQSSLFRFDDPAFHADVEARDYALNVSPFTNPKKMLKSLEERGVISVACTKPGRKKGQFPDDAQIGMTIKFRY
jgi:three-Cys-motif partner protein